MQDIYRQKLSENFGNFIETLQNGYALLDREANVVDANSAYSQMLGYEKEQLFSMNLKNLQVGLSEDRWQDFFKKVMSEESTSFDAQHHSQNDGKIDFWGSATSIEIDGEPFIAVFLRNITEKKEVEEELQKSRQQFKSLFEQNPHPVYLFDLEGNFVQLNDKLVEFTGYEREELLEMSFVPFMKENDLEKTKRHFEEAASGKPSQYQAKVVVKDGEEKDIQITKFPMYVEGEVRGVYGILQDITKEKKAQQKLVESEQRWQGLVENNPQCVIIHSNKKIKYINPAGTELFGGSSPDEIIGKSIFEFAHPEDHDQIKKRLKRIYDGEDLPQSEQQLRTLDGEVKDIIIHTVPIKYDNSEAVQTIMHDITKLKQREKELEEKRQEFKSLFDHNPNVVYSFDLEGNFVMMNDSIEQVSGYTKEELEEMDFGPLVHPDDREKVWEYFEKAAGGEAQTYESRGLHKDGHVFYVMVTNLPIYVNDEIVGVFGIAQDITKQKEMEKQLRASEQKWQHLVENNPQPVQVTVDGKIKFINEYGAKLYGADSPDEMIGRSIFEFTHPEHRDVIEERKKKLEKGDEVDSLNEQKIVQLDGNIRTVEVSSIPIEYQGESAIQTVLHDITDRKQKEKIIKDSLKEKEVLLKEVHHRVKNNMAVISGMLELQSMNTTNENLKNLLEESQLRILSMAMIHEKLYQTDTLSDINFDRYIRELTETIRETVESGKNEIQVKYRLDEMSLNINQAIPCALVLNELVVNSFKHAFNGDVKGIIEIELQQSDSVINLSVRDNGKGLPEDFEPYNRDSLGMSLVTTLINQLEGNLKVNGDMTEGSEFIVTFEKK